MPLDTSVVGRTTHTRSVSWTSKDAMLYALGVGAGSTDALDELEFTTDNTRGRPQRVVPTYGIVLTPGGPIEELGSFDRSRLVHASQSVTLAGDLPSDGELRVTSTVTAILDKGSGALVERETVGRLAGSDEPLVVNRDALFIRGEGGFSGSDRQPSETWQAPQGAPDARHSQRTRPDQALIYRLSGDRNPLHSDPAFAARGGFDRPILHGLCTFGFAARALVRTLCAGDPSGFGSMSGRFARPVMPGDLLETRMWNAEDHWVFQVATQDDVVVIDRGAFRTR